MELRLDDKGEFDEFVAEGVSVHFEMLDVDSLWVGIQNLEGHLWHINITGKGMSVICEDEGATTPDKEGGENERSDDCRAGCSETQKAED